LQFALTSFPQGDPARGQRDLVTCETPTRSTIEIAGRLKVVEVRVQETVNPAGRGTCQVRDAAIALVATALAFIFLILSAIANSEPAPPLSDVGVVEGTLVAAFVTRGEIVLCSDGRVVNAGDGAVVRDDWSKVHKISDRIGMLTAGRDLPNLMPHLGAKLGRHARAPLGETLTMLRTTLREEWAAIAAASSRSGGHGRTFVFLAGFDETGAPRLFYLDSQTTPAFQPTEMPLFDDARDLEIGAIATGTGNQDPSATIVKHLGGLQTRQPTLGLHPLLLGAFNATKAELAVQNKRIGGLTFAAAIDRQSGFRTLQ
jgi:hypothetical protein